MSQMHCLYCDRPLALLKRLTGDGDFCSKEHRRIYQREHNQLALERLLEAQPASNRKGAGSKLDREVPAAPLPPPPPVEAPRERGPEPAGFVSSYPQDASAVSGVLRLTGDPRFIEVVPPWRESQPRPGSEHRSGPDAQPRVALFQAESLDPRAFEASVRFPKGFHFSPAAGARLAPRMPAYDIPPTISGQPGGAGFMADQPAGLLAPGTARQLSEPIFNFKNSARVWSVAIGGGVRRDTKLRAETFLFANGSAPTLPGQMRSFAVEPRWKVLEQALPARAAGRIVLVLESFLRWPSRPAGGQDTLPASFEIRLQPISFPPFSPRMASLEERLHRTDRIGFSPP